MIHCSKNDTLLFNTKVHPYSTYTKREWALNLGDFAYVWQANGGKGLKICLLCAHTIWIYMDEPQARLTVVLTQAELAA